MDYVRSLTSMIDVCLTLEPGFSTLEDLAFLDSANAVHLLGSVFSPKDVEAIKHFSRSLIWCTYRKNWPAPIGGIDGPTSDRGWGCMIRVGQMVLAQALIKLHLGSDWRWPNQLAAVNQRTDNENFNAYQRILRMFQDKRTAIFSIHQIAHFGVSEGKPIGEWLGPNSMAQVLKKVVVYDEWSNLVVHVAMDNVLILDDVHTMVSLPLKNHENEQQQQHDKSAQQTADSANVGHQQWLRPLLLIVPLRLGLSVINPCYFNAIAEFFKLPQSVGILGGRPRHAVYFYGMAGKKLLYLDPHLCQDFTDIDTPPPSGSQSNIATDEYECHLTENGAASRSSQENGCPSDFDDDDYYECQSSTENGPAPIRNKSEPNAAAGCHSSELDDGYECHLTDDGASTSCDFSASTEEKTEEATAGQEKEAEVDDDAFDDGSFHCPYILTMSFTSLDPSLALAFLARNKDDYEDLVHRLKNVVLPSSSPPLFEILNSRPKGWPKFVPFESDFFHDDSLNVTEYDDLLYDSDESFVELGLDE